MIDLGVTRDLHYSAVRIDLDVTRQSDGRVMHPTATGFFVSDESGDRLALVSNRHILARPGFQLNGLKATIFEACADGAACTLHGARDHQLVLEASEGMRVVAASHVDEDVAVCDFSRASLVEGPATVRRWVNRDQLATAEEFASLDRNESIEAGDFLVTIGFPGIDGRTAGRPVLTSGIIASDPLHPPHDKLQARDGTAVSGRYVLADNHSRNGLSGGMVVATLRGIATGPGLRFGPHRPLRVVGVNAGHLTNQSYDDPDGDDDLISAYFYRSDVILECLDQLWSSDA